MTEARGKKGSAEEEVAEEIHVEVKRPLQKIVPVRLSAEHWSELRLYARELGIGPTTLARIWILERLALLRGGASGSGAAGAVPRRPQARDRAPLRLTLDEFMGRLAGSLADDEQRDILELRRESVIPLDAENREFIGGIVLSENASPEMTKVVLRKLAALMGIEIVEEEAEAAAQET